MLKTEQGIELHPGTKVFKGVGVAPMEAANKYAEHYRSYVFTVIEHTKTEKNDTKTERYGYAVPG